MRQPGRRISVVGNSGSGKSTMGRELARRLRLELLELDAVNHQANWTPIAPEKFRQRVRAFVAGPRWVTDGNYTAVGALDLIWERADTVVWLDLPRPLVTSRVVRRSVGRVLRREELWNGNQEQLSALTSLDPERNIVLWAWKNFAHTRDKYERRSEDPRWQGLEIVRLRSPRAVRDWLRDLAPEASRST